MQIPLCVMILASLREDALVFIVSVRFLRAGTVLLAMILIVFVMILAFLTVNSVFVCNNSRIFD